MEVETVVGYEAESSALLKRTVGTEGGGKHGKSDQSFKKKG